MALEVSLLSSRCVLGFLLVLGVTHVAAASPEGTPGPSAAQARDTLARRAPPDTGSVLVRAKPVLRLEAPPTEERPLVAGAVLDANLRSGIPQATVVVEIQTSRKTERLRTVTDLYGRFSLPVTLTQGETTYRVFVEENERVGPSPPMSLTQTFVRPISRVWLTAPLGVTACLLGALLLGTRPWRKETRHGPLRRSAPSLAQAGPAMQHRGLTTESPSPLGRLLSRASLSLAGTVVHARTGQGIPQASLLLEGPTTTTLMTDGEGRFRGDLPPGAYRVTVRAAGYATEQCEVRLPHRGDLAQMRIGLLTLRERMAEVYAEAMGPRLASQAELWLLTPREILAKHVQGTLRPEVEVIASLFERACFSGRPLTHESLDQALFIAEALGAQGHPPTV